MIIEEQLAQLAHLRQQRLKFHSQQQKLQLELQNSDAYMQLDQLRTQTDAEIERITEEIKLKALEEFYGTKNKEPFAGVQVKLFTVVTINDEKQAREWCISNFRPALKLDTKMFEKAAKDGNVPDELAKVEVEPRAQIAADLNEYLKK